MSVRISWIDNIPHILTDPEPVSIPTHAPNAQGKFGRVEYVASHARVATAEEVQRWGNCIRDKGSAQYLRQAGPGAGGWFARFFLIVLLCQLGVLFGGNFALGIELKAMTSVRVELDDEISDISFSKNIVVSNDPKEKESLRRTVLIAPEALQYFFWGQGAMKTVRRRLNPITVPGFARESLGRGDAFPMLARSVLLGFAKEAKFVTNALYDRRSFPKVFPGEPKFRAMALHFVGEFSRRQQLSRVNYQWENNWPRFQRSLNVGFFGRDGCVSSGVSRLLSYTHGSAQVVRLPFRRPEQPIRCAPEGEGKASDSNSGKYNEKLIVCFDESFYRGESLNNDERHRAIGAIWLAVVFILAVYIGVRRVNRELDEICPVNDGKQQDAEQSNAKPARHD